MKREPSSDSLPTRREKPLRRLSKSIKTPLLDALSAYDALDRKRFTVPGHAGFPLAEKTLGLTVPGLSSESYRFDQTEVEGLDVLSEPEECLLDAQQAAAEAFGVSHSYFLINGSSAGMLAAMLSTLKPETRVLVPRNIHRSVISGMILTGANPVWFLPDWLEPWGVWSGITAEQITEQLEAAEKRSERITAVIITSPTYEGIGSDIPAIAEVCRRHGAYLLVDEAHGSLWPFSNRLPVSACQSRCDFVVHSLHKTAGSLTQSSMAHLPHGSRINPETFQQALNTVQTTSPSYLLMASLDATRAFLDSEAGQARIDTLLDSVADLRLQFQSSVSAFSMMDLRENPWWDPTKLYIQGLYEAGNTWACRVEEAQQLAYESTSTFGSLYLAGLGLKLHDYDWLLKVFQDEESRYIEQPVYQADTPSLPLPKWVISPREAFFARGIRIPTKNAVGCIAKETVVHCPPGIPVIIPGELIQPEHLAYLPSTVQVLE